LAVNLIVDGKVRRQAISESLNMEKCCFDVSEFHDNEAQLILIDEHRFYGGWITVDEFKAGDTADASRIIGKDDDIIVYTSEGESLNATG
ncbi:unnamed protein product, partial [marine sediment metagenome]